MTTRRTLFLAALLALAAAGAQGLPEASAPSAPLQVTYYYLPG